MKCMCRLKIVEILCLLSEEYASPMTSSTQEVYIVRHRIADRFIVQEFVDEACVVMLEISYELNHS